MRIISFAWTTPLLLNDSKDVTRRVWKKCSVKKGDFCAAYDRSPRFKGKRVAVIKIVDVRQEPLNAITDEDIGREGYDKSVTRRMFIDGFLESYPELEETDLIWRVEFEVVQKDV